MSVKPVFISYASHNETIANHVIELLLAAGIPVWVDHTNIEPGTTDWGDAIERGIIACQSLIYLASPEAKKSPYIAHEYDLAKHYQLPIYPIWIAGENWLEVAPFGMSRTQFVDGRIDLQSAVARIAAKLDHPHDIEPAIPSPLPLLNVSPPTPLSAHEAKAPITKTPHIALSHVSTTIIACVLIIVIVLGVAIVLKNKHSSSPIASHGPTATAIATATATPSPTATAIASPTNTPLPATPVGPFNGTPKYQDPLMDNSVGGWLIFSDQNHSCGFRNGQYHATVVSAYGVECVNSKMTWMNFAMEVQMTIVADGATAGYIAFRRSSANPSSPEYVMYIYQSGRITFAECSTADCSSGAALGDKIASPFKTGLGRTNTIGVMAKGSQLTIYVNGQSIITANNNSLSSGYLSLGAVYANSSGDVAYANLKIWQE